MHISLRARHTVLAIALLGAAPVALVAQTTAPAHDFSQTVRFETGDSYFLDGDSIVIESITGPADAISPGNVYLVTGTYRLTSHADAVLSSNVTSRGPSGPTRNHDAASEPRNTRVQRGEGHFSVFLHMETDGFPHISMYPTGGGNSFAGVYFGLGDYLMKPRKPGSTPSGTDKIGGNLSLR